MIIFGRVIPNRVKTKVIGWIGAVWIIIAMVMIVSGIVGGWWVLLGALTVPGFVMVYVLSGTEMGY